MQLDQNRSFIEACSSEPKTNHQQAAFCQFKELPSDLPVFLYHWPQTSPPKLQ